MAGLHRVGDHVFARLMSAAIPAPPATPTSTVITAANQARWVEVTGIDTLKPGMPAVTVMGALEGAAAGAGAAADPKRW